MAARKATGTTTGAGTVRVRWRGLDQAIKLLDTETPFYAEPIRSALEDVGRLGQAQLTARAPRGQTRRLVSSIAREVDSRPVPRYVRIGYLRGASMPTDGGFRYPGALEGAAGGAYHYRSGPSRGRPTRGWMSGALPWLRRQANVLIKRAAEQISWRWDEADAPTGGGAD